VPCQELTLPPAQLSGSLGRKPPLQGKPVVLDYYYYYYYYYYCNKKQWPQSIASRASLLI
jgi:hypothetical protein